jgi:hypothetical protein
MLELLNDALCALPALLDQPSIWGSIVINRRKPFTYRAFTTWKAHRLCLHRFEACDEEEALLHPHPWPGAFGIVRGKYLMGVGFSEDRLLSPKQVLRVVLGPGSRYEIVTPLTWHSVVPLEECYTVMINGKAWAEHESHTHVRRTQGKGLLPMSAEQLADMLEVFRVAFGASGLQ